MYHPRFGGDGYPLLAGRGQTSRDAGLTGQSPQIWTNFRATRARRVVGRRRPLKLIRDAGIATAAAATPVSRHILNAGRPHQTALLSASSSLNSSSRVTFFSVTLASSRMKSTTLSSKIGARSWATALALLR